jgi:hypothetical protein
MTIRSQEVFTCDRCLKSEVKDFKGHEEHPVAPKDWGMIRVWGSYELLLCDDCHKLLDDLLKNKKQPQAAGKEQG